LKTESFDVLIIGAGVSGIGMACTLKARCPNRSFVILEQRTQIGGTWDLFRFPGVRSDSDMFSYAYRFRPWLSSRALGEGESIRRYLADTVREFGIDAAIRFGVAVMAANWCSADQRWTLRVRVGANEQLFHARFLVMGTGYFDHASGHQPDFPGLDRFTGPVLHPQFWPQQFDYRGKHVLVIGSGATAVTLVPAMANDAARVTMLQRSPTYLLTLPAEDRLVRAMARLLGARWAFAVARRVHIRMADFLYRAARRWPRWMRDLLLARVRTQLGGAADMRDFTPRYQPWDQRLCIVSDGDLFRRVREGKVEVVTDEIAGFEADRVRLRSGREIPADIVVTATGLKLQALGGIALSVDDKPYVPGEHLSYKGVLLEGLPNAAWIVGYINGSWTLKAELSAEYICRLLAHMERHGFTAAVARDRAGCALSENVMSALSSGYVRRSGNTLPRQGDRAPWRVTHNYREDLRQVSKSAIDDGILSFKRPRLLQESLARPAIA
jgi:cation diffusion facilitator CzcD-associated flavoprotein CzcO